MHEIKRVIEHRITILMFNHIVILQRILKSFIKSKFDSTRFFPVEGMQSAFRRKWSLVGVFLVSRYSKVQVKQRLQLQATK